MGTVRFLLALCVAVAHSPGSAIFGITMMNGVTAVQCFYVISGFLITMILNERPEYQRLGNFYLSRYLRLWPVYILVAALTFFFLQRSAFSSQLPTLANWPAYLFIIFSNFSMFFQDWFLFLKFCNHGALCFTPAFETQTGPLPYWFDLVPQAWTLGVELTFYAVAPFICRRWWSAVGLLTLGICSRIFVGMYVPYMTAWSYRFAPSEMMMFGAGSVAYFIGAATLARTPRTTIGFGSIGIALFVLISFSDDAALKPWFESLSGGGTSVKLKLANYPILFLLACTAPAIFYVTKNSRFDRLVGEMSYPIYVCHIFVFNMITTYLPGDVQAGNALYLGCVVAISLLLVYLVVNPVDRIRRNLLTTKPFIGAPAAAV